MTIFATDPNDTGEILAPEIVETAVMRFEQNTRRMPDAVAILAMSPLPRYQAARHAAVEMPETIATVDDPPAWPAPVGEYRIVLRPAVPPRGTLLARGRHRAPAPAWARLLVAAGTGLTVGAVAAMALIELVTR